MTRPHKRELKCLVRRENAGAVLLDFLCARFPYRGRGEWAVLAAAGRVLVNGEPAAGPLREHDEVAYLPQPKEEPAVDDAVSVIYEDADLIAVNKTGNLPAHPAGRYFRNTLWRLLRERFGVENPVLINRLDRETSGVTLAAKHPRSAKACGAQFEARTVFKKYLAVTHGTLAAPLRCAGRLGPCPGSAVRKKRLFTPGAGPGEAGRDWADTEFFPLGEYGGYGLLEALPHTGRLHQIRATLLHLGLPLAGDKLYGRDEGLFLRFIDGTLTTADREALRPGRQALHASELTLMHPSTGRPLCLRAPLPADIASLLRE